MQTISKNDMFIVRKCCLAGMSVSKTVMVNQTYYGHVRRESGGANVDTSMANDATRMTRRNDATLQLYCINNKDRSFSSTF